jgi:hypothetical protein
MQHLYDRATMTRALTGNLDPALTARLASRIAALSQGEFDLVDDTEILIVETGDTENDIIRHVGFSPLVEPIDGHRFGQPGFQPFWDWLIQHPGWWELSVSFGSTFAYILLIQDAEGVLPELRAMCQSLVMAVGT